ncbi:MAG: hypothetical protein IH899_10145, partial [Planctomycetes bacterium]|nr:hypothetical protein [Planctomycetota bacterium]
VSFVLVVVLATADITTVLLLHPPGRMSLPVALFTVMANSPEGLVASLCLLYLGGVILFMVAAALFPSLLYLGGVILRMAATALFPKWMAGRAP